MSAAAEFRRLLLHAAELLAKVDGPVRAALGELVQKAGGVNRFNWNSAMADHRAYIAASTYAQLVLEMTAKFLTDDQPTEPAAADLAPKGQTT